MPEKRERVLVTGSTGFVGRNLVPELLASGFDLVLPVRSLQLCPSSLHGHPRVQILQAPDWDQRLSDLLRGVSGVIHLAGLAHIKNTKGKRPFYDINVGLTSTLVDEVKRSMHPSFFIHMSSLAAVTGNVNDQTVDDYTPAQPLSDYGRSKLEAESAVAELSSLGIAAISLRPPVIVGSDAKGNWALLLRLAATGIPLPFRSVQNRRSLVSVQTVTEAIKHLCCTKPSSTASGNYCLTDPTPLSLKIILTELRAGFGMSPRLLPVPTPILANAGNALVGRHVTASLLGDLHVDGSRFRSVFGFQSSIGLRTAIRESAAKYQISSE